MIRGHLIEHCSPGHFPGIPKSCPTASSGLLQFPMTGVDRMMRKLVVLPSHQHIRPKGFVGARVPHVVFGEQVFVPSIPSYRERSAVLGELDLSVNNCVSGSPTRRWVTRFSAMATSSTRAHCASRLRSKCRLQAHAPHTMTDGTMSQCRRTAPRGTASSLLKPRPPWPARRAVERVQLSQR